MIDSLQINTNTWNLAYYFASSACLLAYLLPCALQFNQVVDRAGLASGLIDLTIITRRSVEDNFLLINFSSLCELGGYYGINN